MMARSLGLTIGLALIAVGGPATAADPTPEQLATQAKQVLKANCARCHGDNGSNEGGLDYMLDLKRLAAKKKLVPGAPDKSKLLERIKDGEMPPEGETPRPSQADIATLTAWITAGAPEVAANAAAVANRAFRSDTEVLTAIRDHLRQTPQSDRQFFRYFSLANLHNNPDIKESEMRLFRAAFAKTANSLSWQPDVVIPTKVDPDGVVLAVDLRTLGWDRNRLWHRILTAYPYGIRHDQASDKALREVAKEVYLLSGTEIPALRVDWFVATATRPPLYYDLLRLPDTAPELERLLNVDVTRNFARNQLKRAGFTKSGVSRQNRLVERHPASHGAYWKSYDFKSNAGTGSLFRFPLGPSYAGGQFNDQAFVHDGGEMIFNLPNGLQGYYLVDGKEKRIDAGPIEVVRDRDETSGSPVIVNGVSCMACHYKGMIDFADAVRLGHGLGGEAREKVGELYPEPGEMEKLVKKDQKKFLAALNEACEPFGPFLKESGENAESIVEVGEPIGRLARRYSLSEIGATEAAAELGFKEAADLVACIRANPDLKALGLGPLAQGGTIKREVWDSGLVTAFQEVAQRLDLGIMIRVR